MASRQDSLQHLMSCIVCVEEFEEDGDHIPRLLPCTHTLCEACVKQLIRNQNLECPECREKHEAKREEKSFPQNKYLLIQIKRNPSKASKRKPEPDEKELCEEHGEELILFCDEPECKKPICLVCLKKSHKKHGVIDIVEKKEVLKKKISHIEKNLREKIRILNAAKNYVSRKAEVCLKDLEKRRDEMKDKIDKQFDKMKIDAENQRTKVNTSLETETVALLENLNLLSSIRTNTKDLDENDNYSDVIDNIDIVNGIKEMVNQFLSGTRTHGYSELELLANVFVDLGNIVEKQLNIELLEINEDTVAMETPLRKVTEAPQLKCTVKQSFDTGLDKISPLLTMEDGSLVFYGSVQGQQKLKRYNFRTGREISCLEIPDPIRGLSAVELGGRSSLALSYMERYELEFRDSNSLDKNLYTHLVAPKKPTRLCQVSPSVLFYIGGSAEEPEIHWLDCSTIPPKGTNQQQIILPGKNMYKDMCFVKVDMKYFIIVTAYGPQGIRAFNADTNTLEWEREIKGMEKAGVASDRHGHLFVCDINNKCVHMLSVSDGKYLGCLIKEGELSLGDPIWVVWSKETSCLLIAHGKENKRFISVIKLQ